MSLTPHSSIPKIWRHIERKPSIGQPGLHTVDLNSPYVKHMPQKLSLAGKILPVLWVERCASCGDNKIVTPARDKWPDLATGFPQLGGISGKLKSNND
jgi:hypothetical protein